MIGVKSRHNNLSINRNSKSRIGAQNIGKPLQVRFELIENDGSLRINDRKTVKQLVIRENQVDTLRLDQKISIADFISNVQSNEVSELNTFISNTKTTANLISIPFPDKNPRGTIATFIESIQQTAITVELPTVPDPTQVSAQISITQERAKVNTITNISTTQNPQLAAFLQPGNTITTTGGVDAVGFEIEEKIIAGETLPDEFSLNPFVDMAIDGQQTNDVLFWNGDSWSNGIAQLTVEQLLNTTVTTPIDGQILTYFGGNWINTTPVSGGSFGIEDAINVASQPDPNNSKHYMGWNNTIKQWVNRQIDFSELSGATGGGANILNELTDIVIDNPSTSQTIKYNGAFWINANFGEMGELDDVIINLPETNQVLVYNGTNWLNSNLAELISLDELTDVIIDTPLTGQIMQYNGVEWRNTTLPSIGFILTWYITDTRTIGTAGGIATIATWIPRELNTTNVNSGDDVILASNQLTISPGNYNIDINVPFYRTGISRIRLYNITDSNTIAISTSLVATDGAIIQFSANIIIVSTKVIELQYFVINSIDASDLGTPSGIDIEVYSSLRISKLLSTSLLWYYSDTKTIGTVGGFAITNAWAIREVNNINLTGGPEINMFLSKFTVQPGSYHVDVVSSFYKTKNTRLRFQNITDGFTVITSINVFGSENATVTFNFNFDIITAKVYELQYYVTNSDSNIDLGVPSGSGDDEIYTTMRFTKF